MNIIFWLFLILIIIAIFYYSSKSKWQNLDFIQPLLTTKYQGYSIFNETPEIDNYFNSVYIEKPDDKYINSVFLRDVHNTYIFVNGSTEFKVYPLCCESCKMAALHEIRWHNILQSSSNIVKFNKIFTTDILPNKNIQGVKYYLVIEREHLNLLDGKINKINFSSFQSLISLISDVFNKYNSTISDLSLNNLGIDSQGNIKILNLGCIEKKHNIRNIFTPKYGILTKINPELFGDKKNEYIELIKILTIP